MHFYLYCLCGVISVAVDYLIYYFSVTSGVWYQTANFLGYICGTLVSFFLNRKITFATYDKLPIRLMIFFGVAMIGLAISSLILLVTIDSFLLDERLAKILTFPFVVVIQFSLNRLITFNKNIF